MPLMTESTAIKTVLHSAEVVHIPMSSDFVTRWRLENPHPAMYTLPMVYGQEITIRHFNGFL
jgi:hypothetical protein